MIAEAVVIAVLALVGKLSVRAVGGAPRTVSVFLALPLGCAAFVVAGLVAVALGIPAYPSLLLILCLIGAALGAFLRDELRIRHLAVDMAGTGAGSLLGAALFHGRALVQLSPDSFHYLSIGSILARSGNPGTVPFGTLQRRGIAYPLLTSLGDPIDQFYLHSLGPLVALSGLGILGWIAWTALGRVNLPTRVVGVAVGVALVATNNRFIFNAWYLNGHLVFAVWLLLIVGLLWLASRGLVDGLRWLVVPVVAALAVLRPEAGMVVLLVILPAVASDQLSRRFKASILVAGGSAVALWHLQILLQFRGRGGLEVWGLFLLGLAACGAGWAIGSQRLAIPPKPSTYLAVGLVAAVLLISAFDGGITRDAVVATVENQVGGKGLYGKSLLILAALSLAVHSWRRFEGMSFVVFPIATALPFGLLLAFFRQSPYRTGPGDSLNRMLIHWLPVAVLALLATLESRPVELRAETGVGDIPRDDDLAETLSLGT